MLDFLSYYDQAGNEYADVRKMRVYGFDTLFTWFVPGRIGSHDIKIGPAVSARRAPARRPALYQRQLRVPDRPGLQRRRSRGPIPNGSRSASPAKARLLTPHPLDRHLHPRQVAGRLEPDAEPRAALRPAHLAVQQPVQPVLPGSRTIPGRQEQLPAAHRLRLQHGRPLGAARRLRAVLREAVDRPLRDLPAEPRLLRLVHHQLPGQRAGSGTEQRAAPDQPVPGQRARRQPGAARSAVPAGQHHAEHRRCVPRQPDSHPAGAAPDEPRLRAAASRQPVLRRRLRALVEPRPAAPLQLQSRRSAPTPAAPARSSASTSSAWPVSSASRRSSTTSTPTRTWPSSQYDGLSLQLEKRFANAWSGRVSYSVGYARGNTSGLPTAVNDFQVLDDRAARPERWARPTSIGGTRCP